MQKRIFSVIGKKLFCISFILINSFFSQAQVVFNKLFDIFGRYDFGWTLDQNITGYYITGLSELSYSDSPIYLLKIDNVGNFIFNKKYWIAPPATGPNGNSIILLSDSTLFICGGNNELDGSAQNTYILKLNTNGDSLRYKSINLGYNDQGIKIKQINSNEFVIVGHFSVDTLHSAYMIYLIKTDSIGNIQWQKNYGLSSQFNLANSLELTNDGGFIISGERDEVACNCWKIYIIKTDSLGNMEWEKTYGDADGQKWGYAIQTPDSGYMISGRKRYTDDDYAGYIIRTDKNGNKLWEKFYQRGNLFEGFKGIIPAPDGNFTIFGSTVHHDAQTIRINSGWLMKIDPQGKELWSRTYCYYCDTTTSHDYFEDIVLTDDGGYALTGYVVNENSSTKNDAWLVKTDSCGYTVGNSPQPTAGFSIDSTNAMSVFLKNTTLNGCGYKWHFGDGDSAMALNATHTYTDTGTYIVTLYAFAGDKSDTLTDTVKIYKTGVKNISSSNPENDFQVFSDVSNSAIHVKINSFEKYSHETLQLEIFDVMGRKIKTVQILKSQNVIETKTLNAGMYFYKISGGSQELKTGKIVIY